MTGLRLRGDGATIQWGYQVAVQVGRWTLTIDHGTPDLPTPLARIFEGDVVTVQALAARQRPLMLVVPRPRGVWRWPIERLMLTDTAVMAYLGPKEESPHVPLRPTGDGQTGPEPR